MAFLRSAADAEVAAASHMRKLGFEDATATGAGADAGIDVASDTALAQVKWKNAMVGRPEVQRLFGARAMDFKKQLVFYSTSGYSKHALEFADENRIALFTLETFGDPQAVNKMASELVTSRESALEKIARGHGRGPDRADADDSYQPRTAVSKEWREEWAKKNAERVKRQKEARERAAEYNRSARQVQREAERKESKRRRDLMKGVPYSRREKFRVIVSIVLAALFLSVNIYLGPKFAPIGEFTLFRSLTGLAFFALIINAIWRRPAKDNDSRLQAIGRE